MRGSIRNIAIATVLVGLAMGSGAASASSDQQDPFDAAAIRAQQSEIRNAVAARRGVYKDLGEVDRETLARRQETVERLTQGIDRTTELRPPQQLELFNALEHISALVNKAEDERLVCRRHRPTGTNRPTTICRSVAQLRADREAGNNDTGRRTLECSEATMGPGGCP